MGIKLQFVQHHPLIQVLQASCLSHPQSTGQAAGVSGLKAAVALGVISKPMSRLSMSVKDIPNGQDVYEKKEQTQDQSLQHAYVSHHGVWPSDATLWVRPLRSHGI